MFDILQEHPRRTAIIMLSVAAISIVYLLIVVAHTLDVNDGNIGALLDDTWIHVRFAEHISQGEGLSYNDGELTAGATSPLWVLLLAIPFALFDPGIMQQVDIAIIMSAIGHVVSALAITGFGWWATRQAWVGWAAGVLTALTGRYIWMGLTGMEITTFTTFCILSVWSHMHDVRERRTFSPRTGIMLALASLGRPEAALLAALIGLDAFILIPLREHKTPEAISAGIKRGWRGVVVFLLLAGTYPFANWVISGYPVPNTFRAKSQLGNEAPELPRALLWMTNVDHGPLLILLAGIGTSYILWRARQRGGYSMVWALWGPLFILGVLFLGAERYVVNHSRYVAPSIPFNALAAVVGVWALTQIQWPRIQTKMMQYALPVTLVGLMGIITVERGWPNREQVANDVKQMRAMHIQAGFWFAENSEPDDAIALNDVGAMIHISDRRVIDLEGLVYPKVIDYTRDTLDHTCEHDLQLARIMLEDPPRYIAVFPWFYECLTAWPDALQPYFIFEIRGPTVLAGGETVVYIPVWENWPMLATVPSDVIPVGAYFEDRIELAGYQAQLVDGGLEVTLWWRAHGQPADNHHIFVHVVDDSGTLAEVGEGITLQHDSAPQQQGGHAFEMAWWRDGDIIRDVHLIQWEDHSVFQQEGLSLNVGVYRYPQGIRLQVRGGGDFVNLPLASVTE